MATIVRPAVLFGGLVAALALAWAGVSAAAQGGPSGYRSAEFGMSSAEVIAYLENDGVAGIEMNETEDGDLLLDAELQAPDEPETDLRYVFPAGGDQLALVVAFHPDVTDYPRVRERLEAQYGQPWEAEMTEWWFEQLKADMPQEPNSLTMWGGDGGEGHERGRLVRLWSFEDYLSVEYLDTRLLR
ncbi:hypothetical protein HOP51_16920 [Halomonas sp. MCCC 1A11036]|uniref:Uncharacterized protein n=1 Tax=Billgrantia zhangzhouensis TaxID=2733481 RepID=A0ABS9AJ77_9GAMM|nr:hypothetical protein [Halomonas zhangzhouensis]MCE8021781.1 hypothetical protein [Halomonas zhangzhouensis]